MASAQIPLATQPVIEKAAPSVSQVTVAVPAWVEAQATSPRPETVVPASLAMV